MILRIGLVLASIATMAACSSSEALTVQLTGYDSAHDMVEFRTVHYVRGGENNGHYEPDAETRRLALADPAEIFSIISICSDSMTADRMGRANKSCTKDQLVKALTDSRSPYAELQVEGDHITKVAELYQP